MSQQKQCSAGSELLRLSIRFTPYFPDAHAQQPEPSQLIDLRWYRCSPLQGASSSRVSDIVLTAGIEPTPAHCFCCDKLHVYHNTIYPHRTWHISFNALACTWPGESCCWGGKQCYLLESNVHPFLVISCASVYQSPWIQGPSAEKHTMLSDRSETPHNFEPVTARLEVETIVSEFEFKRFRSSAPLQPGAGELNPWRSESEHKQRSRGMDPANYSYSSF